MSDRHSSSRPGTAIPRVWPHDLPIRHPDLLEFGRPASDVGPDFEPLDQAIHREGRRLLVRMAVEALRALDFLHRFGCVHGGIVPDRLLVRRTARLGCRLSLLAPGGTPTGPFAAPEVTRGEPATIRSDLYSLAAVLDAAGGPGKPGKLRPWLDRLLVPNPADRPADPEGALRILEDACKLSPRRHGALARAARLAAGPPPGRAAEMENLGRFLDPNARPRLVWLCGEPGSGKSRLLRWIAEDARRRGWKVADRFPSEMLCQTETRDGRETARRWLEKAREESRHRPVLVLVDEADRLVGPIALVLDRVAREKMEDPVQVVATLRPASVRHPTLHRLLLQANTLPTVRRVDLGPLRLEQIQAMAIRAGGGGDGPRVEELRTLLADSEGNAWRADRLLVGGGGRRFLLSAPSHRWIEALAILCEDSPTEVVNRLARLEGAEARLAAEETEAAGLALRFGELWRPDSTMLAEEVRGEMRPERREELASRAAALLVEVQGRSAKSCHLARLWGRAGNVERVQEYATRTAQISERRNDPAQAAAQFAFALRHLDRRDPSRFPLRLRQAESLERACLWRDAARAYGGALRLAPGDAERAEVLRRQAFALIGAGRYRRAVWSAERALSIARGQVLPAEEGAADLALGTARLRLRRYAEALPHLENAVVLLEREGRGNAALHAVAVETLAEWKAATGSSEAEHLFREAISLHRRTGDPTSGLGAQVGLARLRAGRGEVEKALETLDHVRSRAEGAGRFDVMERALRAVMEILLSQGRLDAAIEAGERAGWEACYLGRRDLCLQIRISVASALLRCGRSVQAVSLMREGLDLLAASTHSELADLARAYLAAALFESWIAREEDAVSMMENALAGLRRRRSTGALAEALSLWLERLARPGSADFADPVYREFAALIERAGAEVPVEARVRGEVAWASILAGHGRAEEAARAAVESVDRARRAGLADYAARALVVLAEAYDALGRHHESGEALNRGRELLHEALGRIRDDSLRRDLEELRPLRPLRERAMVRAEEDEQRLRTLYDMIAAVNSETDPDALLNSILEMALRSVGAERGMVLLREGEQGEFVVRAARNQEPATERDARTFSRNIARRAGSGQPVLAHDALEDPRFRDLKSVSLHKIRSLMCVPLTIRGRVIGTVYLDSRSEGSLFDEEDLRFLEAFSDHAALALENARRRAELEAENRRLQALAEARSRFDNLVGRSKPMQRVFGWIERAAGSDLPVLIQGESGTGKELVARAIHFNGARKRKAFLTENCAAIPESLLESELFGHVRGAFTGAERARKGLFEQADGGTLFLDEVGEMSPGMQARLLRVLETGEVRRVGSDRPGKVDVRVLAATNRDLRAEVEGGRFREDLLYRLQVLVIELPPLRERAGDIPLLVEHFLTRIARERGREPYRLEREVMELLERHPWPGNVRQLENALQRIALLAGSGPITADVVRRDGELAELLDAGAPTAAFSLERSERERIAEALARAGGNRNRAAEMLGISRATIYRKIKQYHL